MELVERQRDRHLRAGGEHRADHLALLAGEVDKAVDVDAAPAADPARGDLPGEEGEPVVGVGAAVCHDGVVALEHERHVPQLFAQRPALLLRGLIEHPGRDGGGLALVHGGKQRRLQLGAAGGRAVELEARADGVHGQRHAQHPPALVEPGGGRAALLLHHAPREAGEGEHLGIAREGIAAFLAQLALGLVAVLFGDDEHAAAAAAADRLGDLGDHGRGLAASRAADDESKHDLSPPFFLT